MNVQVTEQRPLTLNPSPTRGVGLQTRWTPFSPCGRRVGVEGEKCITRSRMADPRTMRTFDLPAGVPLPITAVRMAAPEMAACYRDGCMLAPTQHFELRAGRLCRQFMCVAPDGSSGVAWLPDVEFTLRALVATSPSDCSCSQQIDT